MLLAILQDWNSLDSVRQAHSDLELAGLVFFALIVVAEALAHNSKQETRKHLFDSIGIWFFAIAVLCEIAGYWYGQRNDALSEQVISSLDFKARDAASNASTALDKSGTALSNSKEAETKSSDAVDKAGKAQARVKELGKEAGELAKRLTATEAEEKELGDAIAPRTIPLVIRGGPEGKSSFDELKPYAGVEVEFEVLPDAEAERAASEIETLLHLAQWNVVKKSLRTGINMGYFDGVIIQSRNLPGRLMALPWDQVKIEENREKAGDTLDCFLAKNKWVSRTRIVPYSEPLLPGNKIKIIVGFKPNQFFDPDWVKNLGERAHQCEDFNQPPSH